MSSFDLTSGDGRHQCGQPLRAALGL